MQHTLGHINCPACESARHVMRTEIPASLKFREAADRWIESREVNGGKKSRYVSKRSLKDMWEYKRALDRFFSDLPLNKIHLGHLRQYQQMRSSGQLGPSGREVNPNKINQELSMLVRVMKRAAAWTEELEIGYEPLQHIEQDVPRALTPDEQEHFLQTAGSHVRWNFIHWYSLAGLHTTMSSHELRGLRIADVNLIDGLVMVRSASAKNKYRMRTIPLTDEARWAFERLIQRAHELGSVQPNHFLMPFRVTPLNFDPARSMTVSGLKKIWAEVRNAAGVPHFNPNGLRHTAITRFAEAGTPIPVILSMAGHISRKMQAHYTQISEQAKRRAVDTTYAKKLVRGVGVSHGNTKVV